MPLDPNKVALAIAQGLSAVCATCQKYWEARDRGIPGTVCTTKIRCGSPMSGDSFSDYDGPLKGALHLWCFVCAGKADFAIQVNGRVQKIGACKTHIQYVERLQAVGGPQSRVEVQGAKGDLAKRVTTGKPSLGDAIKEVEDYYAKKEGRDPDAT